MRLKQFFYSINPYQDLGILIRQIADLIVIFISCFMAVLFIQSENEISEIFIQSLSLFLLLSLIFIPTFYIRGIYTHGRNLPVRKKLLELIQACLISGVFVLIIFYIFKIFKIYACKRFFYIIKQLNVIIYMIIYCFSY